MESRIPTTRVPQATNTGFTLLEILVVVAILALLAAILFPVFGRARENARRTSCSSNLKQIGMGLAQYLQDFDEQLPRSAFGPGGTTAPSDSVNYKWMDAIWSYTRNEGVFNCPSDLLSLPYRYRDGIHYGSYGQNGAYRSGGDNQTPPRSAATLVSMAAIARPSETIWALDSNNSGDSARGGSSGGAFGVTWADWGENPVINAATGSGYRQLQVQGQGGGVAERHLGSANVLYCDGHVKAHALDALNFGKQLVDPVDGATKTVLPFFTVEDD